MLKKGDGLMLETRTFDTLNFEWNHLVDPSDQEIDQVLTANEIPKDFLMPIRDPFENARTEYLDDNGSEKCRLLLLEYIQAGENVYRNIEFVSRPFSIILFQDQLITATESLPVFLINFFEETFYNKENKLTLEEVVLKIYELSFHNCVETLRTVSSEIEDLEETIIKSSKNKELYNLMTIERSLIAIRSMVINNKLVIKQMNEVSMLLDKDHQASLHDIYIELLQAESMVTQLLSVTDRMSDIISNVISNNLNNIMKILTSITIVLTIPTIIGGIWGMNVPVPWQKHPQGFLFTLALMLLLTVITLVWLRKNDYL